MNNISPETLTQLHDLAAQRVQASIAADQMWMNYNPLVIAGIGCIVMGILIIVIANEILSHRTANYNTDTRIYINVACLIGLIVCLIFIICFGIGWFMAYQDYIFSTKSPDAAIYQQTVDYLYYGVSR